MTAEEYLKMAWDALLRGDLAERDRLCDLSLRTFDEEERLRALHQSDSLTKN